MTDRPAADNSHLDAERLRAEALRRLRGRRGKLSDMDTEDVEALIHELEVHQVEMEVQNEELRRARDELADARDRYADLYEFAPVAYLTLDAAGTVRRANLTASKLTGRERQQILGRRLELLLAEGDRDTCYQHLQQAAAQQNGHACEVRLLRPDGRDAWALLETKVVGAEAGGGPTGFRVTMTDVTGRRQTRESLLEEQRRLRLALEGGQVGLWDYDFQRNEVLWSWTLYDLLRRHPRDRVRRETFFDYIHPDDRRRVREHAEVWWAGEAGGGEDDGNEEFHDEFRVVRDDGAVRWFISTGRLHRDEHGRPIRAVGVNYDVTDRKAAEEAARRGKALYRALAEHLPGGAAFVVDRELRYVLARGEALAAAGMGPGDLEGRTLAEALPAELAGEYEPMCRAALAGEAFDCEHAAHGRHYISRGVPIRDGRGEVTHVLAMSYDITERREMEEALRRSRDELERRVAERTADLHRAVDQLQLESQDRLAAERRAANERDRLFSLLNMLPGYAVLKDQRYQVRFANHGYLEAFSQPRGRPCHEVQYGLDEPCHDCPMPEVFATGRPEDWEWVYPDGTAYHVWAFPFKAADGEMLLLEFAIDITEQRRLERMVSEMSDAERREIGRDLHDTLGQTMTGLNFLIGGLADRIAERMPEERDQAEQIVQAIREATEQVRGLAHGLNPVGVEAEGLAAALSELAGNMQSYSGIPCAFRADGAVDIPEAEATQLYRIAREAANNAVKHASPGRVEISLRGTKDALELRVQDDGDGIAERGERSGGRGMRIMRFRARAIGAQLRVRRRAGGGTTVRCSLPRHRGQRNKGTKL